MLTVKKKVVMKRALSLLPLSKTNTKVDPQTPKVYILFLLKFVQWNSCDINFLFIYFSGGSSGGAGIYSSDEEESDFEARRHRKMDKTKAIRDSESESQDSD